MVARLFERRTTTFDLGEDDLAAGSLLVELADADDVLDLWDEVVDRQPEHVHRGLAGIEVDTRVVDELDEFGDRRDVGVRKPCAIGALNGLSRLARSTST